MNCSHFTGLLILEDDTPRSHFTYTSITLQLHFNYTSLTLHLHFTYTSLNLHSHPPLSFAPFSQFHKPNLFIWFLFHFSYWGSGSLAVRACDSISFFTSAIGSEFRWRLNFRRRKEKVDYARRGSDLCVPHMFIHEFIKIKIQPTICWRSSEARVWGGDVNSLALGYLCESSELWLGTYQNTRCNQHVFRNPNCHQPENDLQKELTGARSQIGTIFLKTRIFCNSSW